MIHVEKLTKYYNKLCAVDHINLDIEKGEIVGLLGPNGAGKTTTLRMLTGFIRPSSGNINVKNHTITENSLEIKKLIGYLPESAPLYQDMLVYDYLDYVASIRAIDRQKKLSRIRHISDLCVINEVMHKPICELSRGFRQRVGIAHAMISDPEILVLDEPTSGLDPNQIIDIRNIMKEIGKQKTVIISTHILSEAEATCNRVIIISQGKILADGNMESLKQSGGGENLINISLKNADFESVKKELISLDEISGVLLVGKDEDILHVSCNCKSSYDPRGEIYQKIKQTEWILLEFQKETKSLENIFREITKEN